VRETMKWRHWLRQARMFALALIPMLLAIEIVLRLWFMSPSWKVPDPELGLLNIPHARIVYSQEGWGVHHTNSTGWLGPELQDPKPKTRVLLLGNSFTEALHVAPEESFAALAQQQLPHSEFVNTAQSGWSTVPELVLLRRIYKELEPDVVVTQIHTLVAFEPSETHLEVDASGSFKIVPPQHRDDFRTKLRGSTEGLLRHSALLTMLFQRANELWTEQRTRLAAKFDARDQSGNARSDATDEELAALGWTLDRMAEVTPSLIVLSFGGVDYGQNHCGSTAPERDRRIREVVESRGLRLVDPTDAFCAEYARTGQPSHGFHNAEMGKGHLNARGHRIVADLLARAVRETTR